MFLNKADRNVTLYAKRVTYWRKRVMTMTMTMYAKRITDWWVG
jgi:hypothetical protein